MHRLLVIGASGSIGSAAVRAAVAKQIPTVAFLRTPSKLPSDLSTSLLVHVVQGDASSASDVRQALAAPAKGSEGAISAVILAAPFGSMRERGKTGYETIAKNVVTAVQARQRETGQAIKLWIMAGAAVLDHPLYPGRKANSLMPFAFYAEYEYLLEWLSENATDVDWSMNCPAKINQGEPVGPYYDAIDVVPGFQSPYTLTKYLPLGAASSLMYNWVTAPVSFKTLGIYMVDHLDLDERLRHKRVGVLERRE